MEIYVVYRHDILIFIGTVQELRDNIKIIFYALKIQVDKCKVLIIEGITPM